MNKRKQKLLLNTTIFAISNFASKVLVFLMLPIYTSILTTAEYGTADLIISVTTLSLPFLTMCIGDAGLRFALKNEYDNKKVFTQGLIIVFLGTVVLCAVYPLLACIGFIGKNIIYVYIISIPCYFSDYLLKYSRGVGKIREVGISGVLSTFIMIMTNIVCLIVLKLGIHGYLLSYFATYTANVLYMLFGAKLYKLFSFDAIKNFDTRLMKKMLKYSLPLIPNQACWWINDTANKYIINSYLGTESVGLYSAAYKIPAIFTTIQSFFSEAWLLSAIEEEKSKDKIEFYVNYYDYYCSAIVVICSFLMLFSKPLASILYSNSFIKAGIYVPGLLLSSMFGGLVGFIGAFFNAYNETKYLFTSTIIGAGCSIGLNLILTSVIGISGAVFANVLSYVVIWMIRFFEARHVLKIRLHCSRLLISLMFLAGQITSSYLLYNRLICWLISNLILLVACIFIWRKEILVLLNGTLKSVIVKYKHNGKEY